MHSNTNFHIFPAWFFYELNYTNIFWCFNGSWVEYFPQNYHLTLLIFFAVMSPVSVPKSIVSFSSSCTMSLQKIVGNLTSLTNLLPLKVSGNFVKRQQELHAIVSMEIQSIKRQSRGRNVISVCAVAVWQINICSGTEESTSPSNKTSH